MLKGKIIKATLNMDKKIIIIALTILPLFTRGQVLDSSILICHNEKLYLTSFEDSYSRLNFQYSEPKLFETDILRFDFMNHSIEIKDTTMISTSIKLILERNGYVGIRYDDTIIRLDSVRMFYTLRGEPIKNYTGTLTASRNIGNFNLTIVWKGYELDSVNIIVNGVNTKIKYEWMSINNNYRVKSLMIRDSNIRYDIGFLEGKGLFRYFRTYNYRIRGGVYMFTKLRLNSNRISTIRNEICSLDDDIYIVNRDVLNFYNRKGKLCKKKSYLQTICK